MRDIAFLKQIGLNDYQNRSRASVHIRDDSDKTVTLYLDGKNVPEFDALVETPWLALLLSEDFYLQID